MFLLQDFVVCAAAVDDALSGSAAVHARSEAAQLGLAWPQAYNRLLEEIVEETRNVSIEMLSSVVSTSQGSGDTSQMYRIRMCTKKLTQGFIIHITARRITHRMLKIKLCRLKGMKNVISMCTMIVLTLVPTLWPGIPSVPPYLSSRANSVMQPPYSPFICGDQFSFHCTSVVDETVGTRNGFSLVSRNCGLGAGCNATSASGATIHGLPRRSLKTATA